MDEQNTNQIDNSLDEYLLRPERTSGFRKFFRNRKVIFGLILIIIVVIVGVWYAENGQEEENGDVAGEQVHRVTVQEMVSQSSLSTTLNLAGEVVPIQETDVTSLVNGTVIFVPPVGSSITKSDTLFVLSDAGVSANYANAQVSFNTAEQNVEQTKLITSEGVVQARLGLSSAEANLNLAESNLLTSQSQADAAYLASENTALVSYTSAYNLINQTLISLNESILLPDSYVYRGVLTTHMQLRSDATDQSNLALELFGSLSPVPHSDFDASMSEIYAVMLEVKKLVDMTAILLQNSFAGTSLSSSALSANKAANAANQTQVNQSIGSIITARSGLSQADINRQAQIERARNQLTVAQIQTDNARTSLSSAERSANLQVLGSENGLNAAQAQLDQARIQFNNLSLRAPFSGTVLKHFVEDGDQVGPGRPVLTLGRISAVKVTVDVAVEEASKLSVGDSVTIDKDRSGRITSIQPAADAVSGKVLVEIESDNTDEYFISGDTAEVAIDLVYDFDSTFFVPLSVITVDQGGATVWVVGDDNTVSERIVELGDVFGYRVEIVNGIEEGDRVIVENWQFLQDGDSVEVQYK